MLDHWQSGKPTLIDIFMEDFDPDTLDAGYFFRSLEGMPDIEKQALDLCFGKVLDCGAGAGAHALELQRRGLDVLPIDVSEGAVQVMKTRGLMNAQHKNVFDLEGNYDSLLFLMNGIGMAGDLQGLGRLLLHCRRLLNPGGQILLDSSDMVYLYDDEIHEDLDQYYGELKYNLKYKDQESGIFKWLYIDVDSLAGIARDQGYALDIVMRGHHYDYLAQLKLLDEI